MRLQPSGRWTAIAALGALTLAVVQDGVRAQGGPAAVQVDAVRAIDVAERQPVIARLVSVSESVVATRVPGIVDAVHVNVGDRVDAGDPLAVLDTELLSIELEGAEASLSEAEAKLNAATANQELAAQVYERTTSLEGSAAFSRGRSDDLAKELARANAELASAEAALAVARSDLASARYRLANATIRAPFDGAVLAKAADAGDYLSVGDPVARVMDDQHLEIEADVPTEIVGALEPGDTLPAVLDDGTRGEARVRAVVPAESTATRTRPVRFAITVNGSQKPPAAGQSVTVMVPAGSEREVLSVAKDALVQQGGGWIVFAVRDGTAAPAPVRLGAAIEDRIEVEGELAAGDLIVVRGNERLRPGQAVAYEPASTAAAEVASGAEATADGASGAGAEATN